MGSVIRLHQFQITPEGSKDEFAQCADCRSLAWGPGVSPRVLPSKRLLQIVRIEKSRQYDQMGHNNFHKNSGFKPENFNFNDLFKDFDDLFKEFGHMEGHFKNHFGNHKMHHERAGGSFSFEDIKFEEIF